MTCLSTEKQVETCRAPAREGRLPDAHFTAMNTVVQRVSAHGAHEALRGQRLFAHRLAIPGCAAPSQPDPHGFAHAQKVLDPVVSECGPGSKAFERPGLP